MSGGIPYGSLYGGGQPADELRESSSAYRIEVPVAVDPTSPFALPFVARSLLVDNASGAWYSINGRRVPPWTIGAIILLELPTTELTVSAVPPAGHWSTLGQGEPLVIVALEVALAPNPGLPFAPRTTSRTTVEWLAGWSTNAQALLLAFGLFTPDPQDPRYMVEAITVAPAFVSAATVTTGRDLRDAVLCILWETTLAVGPSVVLAEFALSPGQPSVRIPFEPGAVITGAATNNGLDQHGISIEGASLSEVGKVQLRATLEYRQVRVG